MNDNFSQEERSEQWVIAQKYAELYGNLPSSFTTLIRRLRKDYRENDDQVSFQSGYQLKRLLRSDRFKAPFYFAAKAFYPEKLPEINEDPSQLIKVFQANDLSALLTSLYLFKRAKRSSDEKEWEMLTQDLDNDVTLAGAVGLAIPAIGLPVSILCRLMPKFGMVAFLLNDLNGFTEYRRTLKLKGKTYDFEYELKRWGCTHVQIGANLLVAMGLDTKLVQGLSRGFEATMETVLNEDKTAYASQVCLSWMDSLLATGNAPKVAHDVAYYPRKEDLNKIILTATKIKAGEVQPWLNATTEMLEDEAPNLISKSAAVSEEEDPKEISEIIKDL